MKIINDTLKSPDGKYSRKSLTAFVSFLAALVYVFFAPLWLEIKEYVFIGFLSLSGGTLWLTVRDKINAIKSHD